MNAMFAISFSHARDAGVGALVFQNGKVFGSDGALNYDGTYSTRPGSTIVDVDVTLKAGPQGGNLVTGMSLSPGQSFNLRSSFDSARATSALKVQVPGGGVEVTVVRLRDVPPAP